MPPVRPCRVRVVVPHFCREGREEIGYGSTRLAGVEIDLHVFVSGEHYLQESLACFGDRLTLHPLQLDDPRQAALSS